MILNHFQPTINKVKKENDCDNHFSLLGMTINQNGHE